MSTVIYSNDTHKPTTMPAVTQQTGSSVYKWDDASGKNKRNDK